MESAGTACAYNSFSGAVRFPLETLLNTLWLTDTPRPGTLGERTADRDFPSTWVICTSVQGTGFCTAEVVPQNCLKVMSCLGPADCTQLAHPHAVPPASTPEIPGLHPSLHIAFRLDQEHR